uniref:PARP-type domain-containing protein n=1 Tax=Lotharella globosa TaxID=91324 RepID=A0A7S4DXD7_9EUKA
MSDYAAQREERIKKNQEMLKKLGLAPTPKKKKKAPKRKKSSGEPVRKSSRRRKTLFKNLRGAQETKADDDEDFVPNEQVEDDEEDDAVYYDDKPHRAMKTTNTVQDLTTEGSHFEQILKVENAKTGRSKCRKCMEKLEKGELRVGMQAWIMGRQSMTWQHPKCFMENISFTREATGRGKCKISKKSFEAGEARLSLRSHTATSNVKLTLLPLCLRSFVKAVSEEKNSGDIEPHTWNGYEILEKEEREVVESGIKACSDYSHEDGDTSGKENIRRRKGAVKLAKEPGNDPVSTQPESGKKTKTGGKVAWKWGGMTCLGKLLPSRESGTHCYAKTHKGNIKTLTKGKSYWWMVEES